MSSETRRLSIPRDSQTDTHSTLTDELAGAFVRAKNAFVYSSAALALVTMVEIAIASLALSVPETPAILVGGLVTFSIYAHDRIADADTDAVSNPAQAAFVRRHQNVLYNLASLAYGLAVAISILGGPLALATTLAPGVFAVLYSTDVLSVVGAPVKRLKDVFLVNTTIVSLAWAILLTFLPIAFGNTSVTPAAVVVFVYFFLAVFVNVEIPNVRDVDGDRAIGVTTIPVLFGVARTRHVLYGVNAALALLVGGSFATGVFSLPVAVALLSSLVYATLVIGFVGRTDHYDRLTGYAECKSVLGFAVLVAVVLL